MTDPELAEAWDEVHANTPEGWYVGRPGWEDRYQQRSMYAFDASEKPGFGKRSREWTAVGQTELAGVREVARCLGMLRAGR